MFHVKRRPTHGRSHRCTDTRTAVGCEYLTGDTNTAHRETNPAPGKRTPHLCASNPEFRAPRVEPRAPRVEPRALRVEPRAPRVPPVPGPADRARHGPHVRAACPVPPSQDVFLSTDGSGTTQPLGIPGVLMLVRANRVLHSCRHHLHHRARHPTHGAHLLAVTWVRSSCVVGTPGDSSRPASSRNPFGRPFMPRSVGGSLRFT